MAGMLLSSARFGAPFNGPGDIAGLEGDWDADTITQTDGSAVTSLADQSGHSRTATQGASGNQPIIKNALAAFNGHNAIRFDGANDVLDTATFTISQPTTVLIVAKYASMSSGVMFDSITPINHDIRHNGSNWQAYAGSALVGPAANTSLHVIITQFNGASSKLWIDGGAATSGNAGPGGVNGVALGAGASGAGSANADITRWLLYSGAKTLVEINQLGPYLAARYGTSWTAAS